MSDNHHHPETTLGNDQVEQFIQNGFVRIDRAFPRDVAKECCALLWRETGCDPDDPTTWTRPVIRIHDHGGEPFRKAVNAPILHAAFDRLIGRGRWRPRQGIGGILIRFPHPDDPGDTGWHIDGLEDSFSLASEGRALVMLFLFSDVGQHDAPTRIRVGSHRDMARRIEPAGDAGLPREEVSLAAKGVTDRPVVLADGAAGTVYLCHPFLVHAAQRHSGVSPRFLGQPPLHPKVPFQPFREDDDYSPAEMAIRLALEACDR